MMNIHRFTEALGTAVDLLDSLGSPPLPLVPDEHLRAVQDAAKIDSKDDTDPGNAAMTHAVASARAAGMAELQSRRDECAQTLAALEAAARRWPELHRAIGTARGRLAEFQIDESAQKTGIECEIASAVTKGERRPAGRPKTAQPKALKAAG